MASSEQVKQYLCHWFQLGKKVEFKRAGTAKCPSRIFSLHSGAYAPEFEACWQEILSAGGEQCYLEGTNETIQDLLSPRWEIDPCARCAMPVPIPIQGIGDLECPCQDLENWPNTELPQPRSAVNSTAQLSDLKDRLNRL
ncbi:MAG: hypothetical protein AAGG02_05200 [Cyanobacteria bacterium P01_H01_bin.15]